jgi:hypothetical protein
VAATQHWNKCCGIRTSVGQEVIHPDIFLSPSPEMCCDLAWIRTQTFPSTFIPYRPCTVKQYKTNIMRHKALSFQWTASKQSSGRRKPQSGEVVSRPSFELSTSHIQVYSISPMTTDSVTKILVRVDGGSRFLWNTGNHADLATHFHMPEQSNLNRLEMIQTFLTKLVSMQNIHTETCRWKLWSGRRLTVGLRDKWNCNV